MNKANQADMTAALAGKLDTAAKAADSAKLNGQAADFYMTATLSWVATPILNGHSGTMYYAKDNRGYVHLRGEISIGDLPVKIGYIFAYLPSGFFIPNADICVPVGCTLYRADQAPYYLGDAGVLGIINGGVQLLPSYSWGDKFLGGAVQLHGISYFVGG